MNKSKEGFQIQIHIEALSIYKIVLLLNRSNTGGIIGGVLMALIDTYRGNVIRKREAISKLVYEKSKENDKIAKARGKIDSANAAIKRTKNASTIKSKLNEITRAEKEITAAEKKIADIEKRTSKLEKELSTEQKKVE